MSENEPPPSRRALLVRLVIFIALACVALAMVYARVAE